MIPDSVAIAILTVCGVVIAALIGGATTLAVQLIRWQLQNNLLWAWNRALMDHIYRGSPPPPPEPPEGLVG